MNTVRHHLYQRRRPIIDDESRPHLIRLQRNPDTLFSGWGPNL